MVRGGNIDFSERVRRIPGARKKDDEEKVCCVELRASHGYIKLQTLEPLGSRLDNQAPGAFRIYEECHIRTPTGQPFLSLIHRLLHPESRV